MSHLRVRTRKGDGGIFVVYVDGYLNSLLGEEMERAVYGVVDAGGTGVVLNFEGTKLINSIGISFVIGIVERMRERNSTLAFCSLSRINQELFQMTGVSRYVRLFDTEKEALVFFAQSV